MCNFLKPPPFPLSFTRGSDQKMMMKINIKKSSIIPSLEAIPECPKQLWTSNLDLVVGRIHIFTVYFYRPNGSENFFDPNAMKKDRDESGRIVINCNGERVLLVEA